MKDASEVPANLPESPTGAIIIKPLAQEGTEAKHGKNYTNDCHPQ